MSSSEPSQIPGHPKIDIQSRDRKVHLPKQSLIPRVLPGAHQTPLGGITAMGQQKAPLHRYMSGYDYYLSVLPRQVYFQPLSLLQIPTAVSTWQLALLPIHSAVWARHCLGLRRTGPANWLTMSSPVQSSSTVTAALQGYEKNSIRSSSSITLCLGLQQMSGRDQREQ